MIVYPFPVEKMASSPFRMMSDEEKLIEFHFLILPLFTLSAERYLEAHVTEMYPLLPAMQGANTEVIEQAMEELATLYRADETALSQQFTWMQILLERTKMLSKQEKATLGEKLKMYDTLWDEHPRVKQIYAKVASERKEIAAERAKARAEIERAKAEAQAEARAEIERAKAEARAEAAAKVAQAEVAMKAQLQKAMLALIKARFPELTELAKLRVEQIESLDVFEFPARTDRRSHQRNRGASCSTASCGVTPFEWNALEPLQTLREHPTNLATNLPAL